MSTITKLRRMSGPLAGSVLTDPRPFAHGMRYTLRLIPGQHTLGDVQRSMPRISSALEVPVEDLIVEKHPAHPKNPTLLQFTVILDSPIERTVYFDAPRCEGGRILLGPYADGMDDAFFRLYAADSMYGGFILGSPGSGKSRLLEIIAVTAMSRGDTVVIYIDGQDGASSPTLFERATWSGGQDDAPGIVAALGRVARRRNRENRVHGWKGFTPSPARPGILVIVDEQSSIFKEDPAQWAAGARKWRKLGLAILGADQDSNVEESFGGAEVLRSCLLAGNCLVMRTTSRIAPQLIPGLEMNPYELPVLPGYGVVVAPAGSGVRSAPYRTRYAPDEGDAARGRLPVPTIERWFAQYPAMELDPGAARAAGTIYTDRKELAERERRKLEALLDSDDELAGATDDEKPAREDSGVSAIAAASGIESARKLTAREAILALPWRQHREMDRAQISDGLRIAGHEFSDNAVSVTLARLCKETRLVRPEGTRGRYRAVSS